VQQSGSCRMTFQFCTAPRSVSACCVICNTFRLEFCSFTYTLSSSL
jgi:hypothetical protein